MAKAKASQNKTVGFYFKINGSTVRGTFLNVVIGDNSIEEWFATEGKDLLAMTQAFADSISKPKLKVEVFMTSSNTADKSVRPY